MAVIHYNAPLIALHKYSIAIDFERSLESTYRFVVMRGGEGSTMTINDFELFGHTHSNRKFPNPSTGDLKILKINIPTFIVAGKFPHKIIIVELKNVDRFNKWKILVRNKKTNTHPINIVMNNFRKMFGLNLSYKIYNNFLIAKKNRNMFLKFTGVQITPYKPNMKIELRDDPIKEKRIPSVSSFILKDWEKEKIKNKLN